MRDRLDALRASMSVFRRRRGAVILIVALIAAIGVSVWSSYSIIRSERQAHSALERGDFNLLGVGFECDPTACHLALPDGRTIGPALDPTVVGQGPTPIDPAAQQRLLSSFKPEIDAGMRQYFLVVNREFSSRRMVVARSRTLGSLWGVFFVGVLGATLFGAEWRWGVWRTLLTHEPRRGRVLLGKLTALWIIVAAAFALALGLTLAADAVFRTAYHIKDAAGGRTWGAIALLSGRSLLGMEFFATVAAMFAMMFRSSLAGLGGSLAVAVLDGLATRHFLFLRHYLPDQQISVLLPHSSPIVNPAGPWWSQITGTLRCGSATPGAFGSCISVTFKRIQPGTAAAVLGAWLVAAVIGAYLVLRARDIPQ